MKLEINNRINTEIPTNMQKLNSVSLPMSEPKKKSQGKLQNTVRWVKTKTKHTKTYWMW